MAKHYPIRIVSLGRSHYLMIGHQPITKHGGGLGDRSVFMVRWLWDAGRKGHDFYIPRRSR